MKILVSSHTVDYKLEMFELKVRQNRSIKEVRFKKILQHLLFFLLFSFWLCTWLKNLKVGGSVGGDALEKPKSTKLQSIRIVLARAVHFFYTARYRAVARRTGESPGESLPPSSR